jgi:glyoxylase-like metal-dependent hydrolase (beta-lactamase superfamily II)
MRTIAALLFLSLVSASASAGPTLRVFDCGLIHLQNVTDFGLKKDETPVRELFVPCYVIEHAKGRLLWDAGLPLKAAEAGGQRVDVEGFGMTYKRSLVAQLADAKLAPGDIGLVAYSHLHFDHIGAASAFPGATVLMQKAEWDFATGEGAKDVDAELFKALQQQSRTMIEGDHDVFGDGSVRIVFAPGHTPGHQALLVNLEKTGPVLLSGDLYHFRESRALRRTPTFNFDAAETLRSMDTVEALLKKTGATLWIEHDKALADTLRMAPAVYD